MLPPGRLLWHTLVVAVVFSSFVVAPSLLLFDLPFEADAVALALLAVGAASLLGAALARSIDRGACTDGQWRCILLSAWVLNPVVVTVVGLRPTLSMLWLSWWSAIPFAVVLTMLSGRVRLAAGDPDWVQEGCPSAALSVHWLFSRLVFIGLPMCLLSIQVALYLPERSMLPTGPEIGLFVCGACVLISAKFCLMCASLARQQIPQAFVLAIMLSADWVSCLHVMSLVEDRVKRRLLLALLAVAGLVQLRATLGRLHLKPRWSRYLMQRRASRAAGRAGAADLGARIVIGSTESTDSDDDNGPGSLPDGFHGALVGVLGLPLSRLTHERRQFLCGVRSAVVLGEGATAEETPATAAAATSGGGAGVAASDAPEAPAACAEEGAASSAAALATLEIKQELRHCMICLELIQTGDPVRPLPRCVHVFHAQCIENWAKTQRDSTRCPTCRRPALARKQDEGATSISSLLEDTDADSASGPHAPAGRGRAGRGARGTDRAGGASRAQLQQRARGLAALGVSEPLALAALELAGGQSDVAAHVLFQHRHFLADGSDAAPRAAPQLPAGVLQAVAEANPDLAGLEAALGRQLGRLYRSGRLRRADASAPWAALPAAGRQEVFRLLLEEVQRRLGEAA